MTGIPSGSARRGALGAASIAGAVMLSGGLVGKSVLFSDGSDARVFLFALLWGVAIAVSMAGVLRTQPESTGFAARDKALPAMASWALLGSLFVVEAILFSAASMRCISLIFPRALGIESAESVLAGLGAVLFVAIFAGIEFLGLRGPRLFAPVLLGLAVVVLLPWAWGDVALPVTASLEYADILVFAPLGEAACLLALAPAFSSPRWRTVGLAAGLGALFFVFWAYTVHLPSFSSPEYVVAALLVFPTLVYGVRSRFVAACHLIAAIEQAGFVPRALVVRSGRRGSPTRMMLLLWLTAALLSLLPLKTLFLGAVATMSAGVFVLGLCFAVSVRKNKKIFVLVASPVMSAGALLMLLAAHSVGPIATLTAISVAGAGFLSMLLWHAVRDRLPRLNAVTVEREVAESSESVPLLTLHEAVELSDRYKARVLLATLEDSHSLIERAVKRAEGDDAVYVLSVDELPGMFYPPQVSPSLQSISALLQSCARLEKKGMQGIPIWRVAHDPAASISQAARQLGVERVIVAVPERAPLGEVLRGQTLGRLRKLLGKIALEVVRPSEESE